MNARWEVLRKVAQALRAACREDADVGNDTRGPIFDVLLATDAALAALEEPARSEAPDREALVAEVAALRAEVERLSKWNDVINRLNERVKAAEAALATERARAPEAGGFEGHPPGVCLEHSRFRLEGAGLIDTEGPLGLCTGCGKLPPHAGCQAICAACAPPNGTCYCAGCQVAGKASPPPDAAPQGEEPQPAQSAPCRACGGSGLGHGRSPLTKKKCHRCDGTGKET